jgi:hypothetical protein
MFNLMSGLALLLASAGAGVLWKPSAPPRRFTLAR